MATSLPATKAPTVVMKAELLFVASSDKGQGRWLFLHRSQLIQHSWERSRLSYNDLAPLGGDADLRLLVRNSTPVGSTELCKLKPA
jgi:hypothetical protein